MVNGFFPLNAIIFMSLNTKEETKNLGRKKGALNKSTQNLLGTVFKLAYTVQSSKFISFYVN